MFEKSLYDLIRGLRNHKGNEKEYMQNCLKECRSEIRSQDLDLKATALLKLIYLEMFGHDMSWASFNVLEVMASPKYHQKRVGYLGAIQSFRPDTEVLMLATNLLKKDLTAAPTTTIALPIVTLPHVITPSLALSVLPDLLPRLNHTHPAIRKKTIVTLYRLALVYPETLRAAWPRIKDRLMDRAEDPSVTAAIVNVICELGWRRPHDFLPLAPRLFELLVDSGNNWMAIKLIKLFATLTPLEPRLVRKLLPPLTEIIRTTPAMSLLYECISGIIQGGILGSGEDSDGREEIASLCVNKLRGMIMIDGDPNLKYVALLAFNQIVVTHPWLVAQQEDVILECIDSTDISIRIKALDLVQGMVSGDNLVSIVSRLMRQLKLSSSADRRAANSSRLSPEDSDDEDFERTSDSASKSTNQSPPLPDDYRIDVIGRILNMCSQNNYGYLTDFEWYLDILTQLVRTAPIPRPVVDTNSISASGKSNEGDISERIGGELRNITVKVQALRPICVRAAEAILSQLNGETSIGQPINSGALKPVAWIIGEFSSDLSSPDDILGTLLQTIPKTPSPESLAACLQASMKVFSLVTGDQLAPWTPERKSKISLLMARIIHSFESLVLHPNLEVQERAVEFIELLKLTAEAASSQEASTETVYQDPPLLLTQAIPSLFAGWELNSVAQAAQKNVPLPDGLDLDEPINPNLNFLLSSAESISIPVDETDEFESYYYQRPPPTSIVSEPAINKLADSRDDTSNSYQQPTEETYLDADILAKRKAERLERNRDDPFYIQESSSIQRSSTPIHNILQNSNGPDLDVDSIPIMELDLDKLSAGVDHSRPHQPARPARRAPRQKIVVAADENLASSGLSTPNRNYDSENSSGAAASKAHGKKLKQSLLGVDSTSIGALNLEDDGSSATAFDPEARQREEAEMAQAVKEVERLRLEMQRANERIQVAQGVDAAGTVVKKKKTGTKAKAKKPKTTTEETGDGVVENNGDAGTELKVKKKKKKVATIDEGTGAAAAGEVVVKSKPKKKKAKPPVEFHDAEAG
ncbi:Adaptor protein complex AP-3 delta subunit [Annulohypoxylon maeteangense]|uniref:Adaptor protein complex AP-3 delta subunit n=1 Tax=Annulohypoxylon maeteangense TaxID=1927788 RepID=UPI00200829A9|nr:Adaptor protein complex AP-3 delta subunit [Annulohypoxylon maeteangense]KAI0885253.1 Adaptor protein complex AP-3 delta subunit [Annulohypoxylon maeteangense]